MSDTEIDILSIDRKIQANFEYELSKLPSYKDRLKELEKTCSSGRIPVRTSQDLSKNISELSEKIRVIETREDYNFYISESVELLKKYRNILKIPVKVSFTKSLKKLENKEKKEIINSYLKIAQKYCELSVDIKETKSVMECPVCANKKDFAIEDSIYVCVSCGTEQETDSQASSYKDSDRVNMSTKYTYDKKVHFRDCINQYQGKQNCTIEQKVYNDLEDVLERHHLLIGDKETKREIRFSKVTRGHIGMFLKELEYSKHYENLILIHYTMTGKKPDDISYLEDVLMSDFDLLIETYDKLYKKKVDRVNFISTQFVLYQLLQKHRHPCKKEDFVIPKTVDRKSSHESICRNLFSVLGWNYFNV